MHTAPGQLGDFKANFACFTSMVMWSVAFPAGEVILQSWGVVSTLVVRFILGAAFLMAAWVILDGLRKVLVAPWLKGMWIGSLGFGLGSALLLYGQKISDPVTPAIAAAMTPISGALLEVFLDNRRLKPLLLLGIILALLGGCLAAGVDFGESALGFGALVCFTATFLFSWGTRSAVRNLPGVSIVGQTSLTMIGAALFMVVLYGVAKFGHLGGTTVGVVDAWHAILFLVFALVSLSISHFLWIWGADGLGILLASFHMNALPFYVMVLAVLLLGAEWSWIQAAGALLVGIGVVLSQFSDRKGRLEAKMASYLESNETVSE